MLAKIEQTEDKMAFLSDLLYKKNANASLERCKILVEQAGLTTENYANLCVLFSREQLPAITSSWQLQVLTGEKDWLALHFNKKDSQGNNILYYAMQSGIPALENILEISPDFWKTIENHANMFPLCRMAVKAKNMAVLEWIYQKKPERIKWAIATSSHISNLLCQNNWLEGYKFLEKVDPEDTNLNNYQIIKRNGALQSYLTENNKFPPPVATSMDVERLQKNYLHSLPRGSIVDEEKEADTLLWLLNKVPGFASIFSLPLQDDYREFCGDSLIHVACSRGYGFIIKHIVEKKPELLDLVNDKGESAIWRGVIFSRNNFQFFNYLMTLKKDTSCLHGIQAAESENDDEDEGIPEMLGDLTTALEENFSIQKVEFTQSTQKRLSEYIESLFTGDQNPELMLNLYLNRNKRLASQLHLLMLCSLDNSAFFGGILVADVVKYLGNMLLQVYIDESVQAKSNIEPSAQTWYLEQAGVQSTSSPFFFFSTPKEMQDPSKQRLKMSNI